MDLTLYGICFKMRDSLNLLDYVQSGKPVPIEIMQQVMDQMSSVSKEEIDFAEKMRDNWKKAVNERVPMLMGVAADGGYEITCNMPNELLETIHILTGLEDSKIVEEYTADYLKNVCGIDASIISVDVENADVLKVEAEADIQEGFNIGDLDEEPEGPAFEDVTTFGEMDTEMGEAPAVKEAPTLATPVVAPQPEIPVEEPAFEEDEPAFEEGYMDEGELPYEEEVSYEEPVMEEEPVIEEPAVEEELEAEEPAEDPEAAVGAAMAGIYKELIINIKDKKLDERLGLEIGNES